MKVRERLDEVNNVLQENLAGAKVVRAFARQEHEAARFDEKNRAFLALSLRVGTIISVLFPLLSFIGQMAILLTVWAGGQEVIRGMLLQPAAALRPRRCRPAERGPARSPSGSCWPSTTTPSSPCGRSWPWPWC